MKVKTHPSVKLQNCPWPIHPATVFIILYSLLGPTGPSGATGAFGAIGPTGPSGATGSTGKYANAMLKHFLSKGML